MDLVPGPLTRTFTAPSAVHNRGLNPPPLVSSHSHGGQFEVHSQSFSGSAQNKFPGAGGPGGDFPVNGGPVMASDNIINQVADKDKSLFQICINLRQRLSKVPGFQQHLNEILEEDKRDDTTDPVTSLWKCFRRGYPLLTLANALDIPELQQVDESRVAEAKRGKAATFKFLQVCLKDMKFPPGECFLITDLYGDDTTGFVKVTKVVNRVLNIILGEDVSAESDNKAVGGEAKERTHMDWVVDELVTTERTYVQHLEVLQQFKKQVEEGGVTTGDAIHDIFLNLNALLDFQRRFLIRVETMNALPKEQQNWGRLFTMYQDSFQVYEPYIANQKRCEETAMREFDKLRDAGGPPELRQIVDSPTVLTGFLLKPFQRLAKYPLLLKELRDKCDLDKELQADLTAGMEAASAVLERTNAAIDREARAAAVSDLSGRVEDWKGHKIEQFGDLLLYGTFTVLKGDGAKDIEREVRIFFNGFDPDSRNFLRKGSRPTAQMMIPVSSVFKDALSITTQRDRSDTSSPQSPTLKLEARTEYRPKAWVKTRRGSAETSSSPLSRYCSRPPASPTSSTSPSSPISLAAHAAPTPSITPKNLVTVSPPSSRGRLPSLENSTRQVRNMASVPISNEEGLPSTSEESSLFKKTLKKFSSTISLRERSAQSAQARSPNTLSMSRSAAKSTDTPPTPFSPSEDFGSASSSDPSWTESLMYGIASRKERASTKSSAFTASTQLLTGGSCDNKRFPLSKFPGESLELMHITERAFDSETSRVTKGVANESRINSSIYLQYKVYLFERILLCCKEMNPNKQKNKIMSSTRPLVDKRGKPRLQLKGRIFMQNVTETVFLHRPGSYTVQIYWKGDPGVENFVIKFANEETMRKWAKQVDLQRQLYSDSAKASGAKHSGTSETEFTYMRSQSANIQNPYQEDDLDEDEPEPPVNENANMPYDMAGYSSNSDFSASRNASSTSLRSRSTTGDSGPPMGQGQFRVPPPRFPMNTFAGANLSLHTQLPGNAPSPGERGGNSYFSPTVDSPLSTRTSGSSGMYPFPRQATPSNGWPGGDEQNRFTAPAMGRTVSREGQPGANGRSAQRPSLPAMTASQNGHQVSMSQSRLRSASSPDIHNPMGPGGRRLANGHGHQPPVPDVPVPPFPPHMAHMMYPINRSQTNSPSNGQNGIPIRSATQSPNLMREQQAHPHVNHHPGLQYSYDQQSRMDPRQVSQNTTPIPLSGAEHQMMSPPTLAMSNAEEPIPPTQLKVKVSYEDCYVTLVVGMSISYQSLADRIDAKLSRFTKSSIGRNMISLRYVDEDGDYVTIQRDEDVQTAFQDWREQNKYKLVSGQLGEIHMVCQPIVASA
ncbi:MAG: hypothetical protein M1819_005562 [Sarea resinae]|nr:MAG: hypothetical protein M1819_005562 [Sarea resinae]